PEDVDDLALKLAAAEVLTTEGKTHADLVAQLINDVMTHIGVDGRFVDFDRFDRIAGLAESTAQKQARHLPRQALQCAVLVNGYTMAEGSILLWEYAGERASKPWTMLSELDALLADFPTIFYLLERGFGWLQPRNGKLIERKIEPEFWTDFWPRVQPHS